MSGRLQRVANLPLGTPIVRVSRTTPQENNVVASTFTSEHENPEKELSPGAFLKAHRMNAVYNLLAVFLAVATVVTLNIVSDPLVAVLPGAMTIATCIPYLSTSFEGNDYSQKKVVDATAGQQLLKKARETRPKLLQTIKCFRVNNNLGSDVEMVSFSKAFEKKFEDWYDTTPQIVGSTVGNNSVALNSPSNDIEEGSSRHEGGAVNENQNVLDEFVFRKKPIIRLTIMPEYVVGDEDTRESFEFQTNDVVHRYSGQDINYRYSEVYKLPEIPTTFLVHQAGAKPWFISLVFYRFIVFLGCAFPFQCILEHFCIDTRIWKNRKVLLAHSLDGVADVEEATSHNPIEPQNSDVVSVSDAETAVEISL